MIPNPRSVRSVQPASLLRLVLKHAALVGAAAVFSVIARAEDAFPWGGAQTLHDKSGASLEWTVKRVDGVVLVEGRHAKWTVDHRARPDGSPVETVKITAGRRTHVVFSVGSATFTYREGAEPKTIRAVNLWDGDSLDARLAGIAWAPGTKVHFRVIDTDSEGGDVYPMVAEYIGQETCGTGPCHHVKVSLDDWRSVFGPSWHFKYAADPGARYLETKNDGERFVAP